jgi:hypothetical protein
MKILRFYTTATQVADVIKMRNLREKEKPLT